MMSQDSGPAERQAETSRELTQVRYLSDFSKFIGKELGVSSAVQIDQEKINAFAEVAGDKQWIHTDPQRAQADGSLGGTIAHGYLVLSHLPVLMREVLDIQDADKCINCGIDKLRFTAPLPSGSSVSARLFLEDCSEIPNGVKTVIKFTFESAASEKPICVGSLISHWHRNTNPNGG